MKENNMSFQAITGDTTIEDIVEKHPELVKPLMNFGIKCIACGEPVWGTLEENAREKNIDNLPEIIVQLNRIAKEKNEK